MSNNTHCQYLDYLKLFLTVLVIFQHTGLAYASVGVNWPYATSNPDELLPNIKYFLGVNATFFMGLFFFISGYFVPKSYDRQGPVTFIKKKLLRLGIPLVVMTSYSLIRTAGLEIVGHMWFVESLLIFCLLYAAIRLFFKPLQTRERRSPSLMALAAFALAMGFGSHLIRQVYPQDHWVALLGFIYIEPAHYLQYVMMFVAGILACRGEWLDAIKDSTGITCWFIALFVIVIFVGVPDFLFRWYGFFDSFLCVSISTGLLWLFRRYFNHSNRVLEWCASQRYGAYLFQQLILVRLQYTFDNVWMGNVGKFIFLAILTCILSFGLTWALRVIPGVKKVL